MRTLRKQEEESEINLTPMLDVVFIMLIFFIVTASFVKVPGVEVIKPLAQTGESKPTATILVAVTDKGQIWIQRRKVDARAVRANIERLHAENPLGALVIEADEDAETGLVMRVMDAARQAGVSKVSLATEIPQ